MRSRFLSTDFFSSSDETLAHFRPLYLPPPPPLPSPDPHIAPVPSFFDLVPDHSLCFDIGGFHVENALFQFLSDVVPGFLVSGEDDRCDLSEIELSEKLEEYLCEEGEAESSSISLSDGSRIGLEKGFQFEVVEVDLPLRDCESSLMKKQAGLRFLIPDIEVPLDTVNIGMAQAGTKVPYPRGVAKSIFSMEDILVTSNADQDSIAVKDGSSLLYGYTPLEQCLEEEPIIFDPVLDMDLLNFSGNLLLEKGSAIYPITPDGDHSHLPCSVHFQEVQILDSSHTFQIFGSLPTAEGGVSQGIPSSQGSFNHHIIEMLNFEPVEEKKRCRSPESANQIVLSYENDSSMSMSSVQSKNTNSSAPSAPDVVIIVNTQSIKKKMLISRRSSYQKILTMEKGGAQVIEREINLPLDLIFNAAVCVVWYEARNFTDNQERTEVSSITIFVEDVATNILMSLSFAFSGCIMIFEGDISFLAAIMDSSDALYAAAASLDMNLQLFCSYASETTDEIILGSIRNATKLNRSIYPAMPESETIGESFLTKFPSINPLTAHAILSSGGLLVEFLEWSHERRIQAIGKYYIPEQSMSLFSSVCRYGELGESKSVMTECSSIDSDSSSGKLQPNRKRHKIAMDSCTFSMPFGNLSPIETLNQSNEYITNKAQTSQPYQSKNFCTNRVLGKNWGFNESVIGNLAHDIEGHECINENLVDEVIDQNPLFFGEKISQSPDTVTLSKVRARNETVAESSQSHRSMFHTAVHQTFPTAAEINCDTDKWPFLKFQNQDLKDEVCGSSSLGFEKDDFTVKDQEQHLKENFSSRHFLGPSSANENIKPHYSGNAFLNTIQSQRTEKGSNWTMELLHRVKEKRRMHQQSLQSDTSPGLLSSLKNKDKSSLSRSPSIIDSYRSNPSISRSPSIIDSYRYQGSNQSKKVAKQRWNKGTKTQLNSKFEEKNGPPLITPTWTPIDKRARQNLSFTRKGNEKQSKLVWRSRNSPNIGFNLRKRYRDEG
ncbi:hypothetical protein J5N97_023105 [Dioscorea zingiberensis]|uniref:Protein SHORTAGE IN CHIASMATA 1 n=1 Tax=Dioscorea zingiberensis TaxID=325984 RepID=A0A9D5CBP2_9LILI|nr:hypothetical protein J5N97_023105 [Dioscorea zingiberensis]